MAQAIDIGSWRNLLEKAWAVDHVVAGNVAIVKLVEKMSALARRFRADIGSDVLVQRGLGDWETQMAGLEARIVGYYTALSRASEISDVSARLLFVQGMIGFPIVRGRFPAAFFDGLPEDARTGLRFTKLGSATSFGDGWLVATLLNQVVAARSLDLSHHSSDAGSAIAGVLTETAVELERSAPGEDPTVADRLHTAGEVIAEGAQGVLDAVRRGLSTVVFVVGGVAAVAFVGGIVWLVLKAKQS